MTLRAAVLVDVDGVLNPHFACRPPDCPCHPLWVRHHVHPDEIAQEVVLNPGHGAALLELAAATDAELIWATTWCNPDDDHANVWIAPHVGLPALPYIPIPARPRQDWDVPMGVWKARQAAACMGNRPFVWFDDDPDIPQALAELAAAPHLVITVDESTGLTDDHLHQARTWLSTALG